MRFDSLLDHIHLLLPARMAPLDPPQAVLAWLLPTDLSYLLGGLISLFTIQSAYLGQTFEMWITRVVALLRLLALFKSSYQGFPDTGNGLWYNTSGNLWVTEWLPVGNGYLAAMVQGGVASEVTQLNIESLWSGGSFSDPAYNGGNKAADEQQQVANYTQQIRRKIFQSSTGTVDSIANLTTPGGAFGSYAGAGYLVENLNSTGKVSSYMRWLDLDQGIVRTTWTQRKTDYLRSTFCSHPIQACIQHITSTDPSGLPAVTYAFSSALEYDLPTPNITCLDTDTLLVRGTIEHGKGMLYELIFRARITPTASSFTRSAIRCAELPVKTGLPPNATLTILSGVAREAWITWVGGTEYSSVAGDAAHQFSFRGPDPHDTLLTLVGQSVPSSSSAPGYFSSYRIRAPPSSYDLTLAQHIVDYKSAISDRFSLSLGQHSPTPGSKGDLPTDYLLQAYQVDVGNPYLEWVLFNYGRYMLVSSGRGTLPANLQGKWADGATNAWSADYHANINIQMNYWPAEMSNMAPDVVRPLFDYLEKTWAPRGAYTAQVLYNISRGWVVHNEMNIFGHTGMKGPGNTASWSNYPEANAWMMLHVWDHFDYTNDLAWWKAQGWPLLKGVAGFHLDKLIPDLHFDDGTLVVNPCNSPEQGQITFGCAHAQQLIWQLFNAVEKGFEASGDTDHEFLEEVRAKRAKMDKGLHIGSWGQLQEWKKDMDSPSDMHRHLSHLIGLYPGYAIAGYDSDVQGMGKTKVYTRQEILEAAAVSLLHRGNGTGPDGDAGWEKAWRAAMWAQLGYERLFYMMLTYTVKRNFAGNLFSVYEPSSPHPFFQIDANLAYPSVVLNAIVQVPDVASYNTPLTVTLLPALPKQWASGFIRGARIRAGMTLDMTWHKGSPINVVVTVDRNVVARPVRVVFEGRVVEAFTTAAGLTHVWGRRAFKR